MILLDVADLPHRKQQKQVGQDGAEGQRQEGQAQRPGETHRTTHRSSEQHTKRGLEWTRVYKKGERGGKRQSSWGAGKWKQVTFVWVWVCVSECVSCSQLASDLHTLLYCVFYIIGSYCTTFVCCLDQAFLKLSIFFFFSFEIFLRHELKRSAPDRHFRIATLHWPSQCHFRFERRIWRRMRGNTAYFPSFSPDVQ